MTDRSDSAIPATGSILRLLMDRRMMICLATGFASGLPLYVVLQLVPAWLRLEGVSLTAIGFFTAVQYPYVIKFLWAPLVERYPLSALGRRRSWMLLTQVGLIFCIGLLGFWRPQDAMSTIVLISVGLALFSATQDIVLDAYRREILQTDGELAMGNTVHVQAYRVAGLVPGTLGMILAGSIGWDLNFMIMAAFMSVGLALPLLVGEPKSAAPPPQSLWQATVIPFQEFFQRRALGPALAVLAFMVLYKLGDNMATALATPFYLDMGFSTETIGVVAKGVSLWAVIIGGVIGAFVVARIGINRSLWTFGVVQMITILGFVWLSQAGADVWVLGVVIAGEYIGVGLGTTASVAFIARETSRLAVATQFAMFTALASLPRVVAASFSGLIVDSIGWTEFFYFSTLLAIPGMLLLFWVAPFNTPYNLQQDSAGNGEG
jgi:PAT family beta-lactamase induction signal transducer AmpG